MNILYIHQYFHSPAEPGGTRSYWISKELIKRGHKVIVVTSTNPNNPDACEKDVDGIRVIYIDNTYLTNMTNLQKIKVFIRYVFKSIQVSTRLKDIDLVYATSTPLTVGAIALFLRVFKRWRYIFEVRDLWPEFPIQVGAIRNPFAKWFLRKFEKRIYMSSEHVVALSPGMQDGVIAVGIPEEKTSMIPNMSKPDLFYPHEVDEKIVNEFGINRSKFNVIHFGSMNFANGLEYIIEAARILAEQDVNDIHFIFMGSGAIESSLKQMVKEYRLSNVTFLGYYKMKIVIEVVNCCDASITTFRNLPILATNSPNKLFDSLSAGKPVIVNSPGWTKDLVEQGNCGFYAEADHPESLVTKLIQYKDKKGILEIWGKNARKLSETVYDKAKLSSQVVDVMENVYSQLVSVQK